MSLNENLKRRRMELKLSQEYVAHKLGVSRQAVSKWESGRSKPTAKNLAELAAVYETSLSELTGAGTDDGHALARKRDSVLRLNLLLLGISAQAGMLYSCTNMAYITQGDARIPDWDLQLVKIGLLFVCSLWMAGALFFEKDLLQRRKNSRIELLYCLVQLTVAYFTWRFRLGLPGLLIIVAVLLFYVLYINPRYMNRPFGKKQSRQAGD